MIARALEEASGLSLQALMTAMRSARPSVLLIVKPPTVDSSGSGRFFIIRCKDLQGSFYFREGAFPGGVHSEELERSRGGEAQPSMILVHEGLEASLRRQGLHVEAEGHGRRANLNGGHAQRLRGGGSPSPRTAARPARAARRSGPPARRAVAR